jgi:PAS domain S-box-containing protein
LIAENIDDLIAVLDPTGRRLYASPSYLPLLGDPETLRGTDSFNDIHPDDRERIRSLFRETVQAGIGRRSEYRLMTREGKIRHIESQGSVVQDHQGSVSAVIVVSRDITEKKQLERQFLRMERMESIGTLAGGVAHDLNNVLSPILLSLNILKKRLPDEGSQKLLSMLESAVERGSGLIRQMLSFARGTEGERTAVDIGHLVDEIEKIVTETFPRTIALHTEIPDGLPTISGDPTQLHQVLMNLCVNARDAMSNGGSLEIRAETVMLDEQYVRMHLEAKPGLHLVLSVTDQGVGIPPGIIERIFEPFFTTKDVGKGTGLGLATVLGIVKSHDGFVNVYSELGRGTTFKVYLPALETPVAVPATTPPAIPTGRGELILVVDDEASIREITKATLESYNYAVLTAADGTEAVAAYATHGTNIRLVVTDMVMPYLDGNAMIRAIQKLNPKVRIIAVSGLKQNEEMLRKQMITFLHKPYTSETLLKAVHEILIER